MALNHFIDTSDELLISRSHRGVQLLRPNKVSHSNPFSDKISLGRIKKMPFNVYVLDANSRIQSINEATVASIGFVSIKDGIGKTMFDILPEENARYLIHTDKTVLQTNQTKIIDDLVICKDGTKHQFLTVKTPLYNADHTVVGVFGCSVLLNDQPLAIAISQLTQLGLLQPQQMVCDDHLLMKLNAKNIHLTQRELQVLSYLFRGKSARETGEVLHLSQRTIEYYLNSLKYKLNCKKKSELIEQIYKHM